MLRNFFEMFLRARRALEFSHSQDHYVKQQRHCRTKSLSSVYIGAVQETPLSEAVRWEEWSSVGEQLMERLLPQVRPRQPAAIPRLRDPTLVRYRNHFLLPGIVPFFRMYVHDPTKSPRPLGPILTRSLVCQCTNILTHVPQRISPVMISKRARHGL